MKQAKPREAWLFFNEQGELYQVKIIYSDWRVTEIPVSNTNEKTVRRQIRDVFGYLRYTTVRNLPTDKNHAAN